MKKILVVDDSPDLRQMLEYVLVLEGYVVETSANGLEALQKISEKIPDLILLDMTMPVMDGREFLSRLRALPLYAAVPVILFTGSNNQDLQSLPAEGLIVKPFELETLLTKLSSFFATKENHLEVHL